jgi:hypothetical protein
MENRVDRIFLRAAALLLLALVTMPIIALTVIAVYNFLMAHPIVLGG